MAAFRLLPEAETELDDIWLYVARASGSIEIADRLLDTISGCFWMLAQHPRMGRRRDADLRPELRSFPVGEYIVIYRIAGDEVLILRVMHGSRDIAALLGE